MNVGACEWQAPTSGSGASSASVACLELHGGRHVVLKRPATVEAQVKNSVDPDAVVRLRTNARLLPR